MLCGLDIPFCLWMVLPDEMEKSLPADQLYMDNITGTTKFVNDMLAKGRTRIGFVGDYDHCQSFYERYTAFYLAVAMAGYSVDPAFVIKYNHLEEMQPVIDSMKALPDVFICANDFVAADLLQALAAVGKRVPDDVLICGFDDSAESRCPNRL